MQTQKEITEAFQAFQQYLSSTESRLLHSHSKVGTPLASEQVEHWIGKPFPEIKTITFIPIAESSHKYTTINDSFILFQVNPLSMNADVIYLGNGLFKKSKFLYDQNRRLLGIFQATFSLVSPLSRNFLEDEIEVIPDRSISLSRDKLFFKIPDFPYFFVLTREIPSFLHFLWEFKGQLFLVFIFGMVVFGEGMAKGVYFYHKKRIKQRYVCKKLEEKNQQLSSQFIDSKNLERLREEGTEELRVLMNKLQERYRCMATQLQIIQGVISELGPEKGGDIHHLSEGRDMILYGLVSGLPMKNKEEQINVIECLEKIKTIFLPDMTEKSVHFEIKGVTKEAFVIDQLVFELVLHNVFHMVMDRLNKNNIFKIIILANNSLQLMFFDDGYGLRDKDYNATLATNAIDILRLNKSELSGFVEHLGWGLFFEKEDGNIIRLIIPLATGQGFPSNVIQLSDFKPQEE